MILYHGTSSRVLDRIVSHGDGIECRAYGQHDSHWEDHPSHEDMVYLTDCYAMFFASVASTYDEVTPVVLEVEVDELSLYPDEDFLEQATREGRIDDCPKGMSEATAWFRERLLNFRHHALDSLKHLGTVAHYQCVDRSQILRAFVFEHRADPIMICDPCITLMNHHVIGQRHADSHKALFNRELNVPGKLIDLTQQENAA